MDELDALASQKKIPIANQIDLAGHAKAVTCLSIEPSGNRIVTGSLDYELKIYDFGGMDSRCRPFKSIEAQENHIIVSISHSPTGDRFIVGTGSAQPILYDRDGNEIIKFAKGDMYLRDLSNTKGHTMEVTQVQWHPTEKNTVLSSSLDGSLRLWNLLGEATFGNLMNKHLLKIRGVTGQVRVGATCCCFTPDGLKMIGGATDGSIQIWNQKRLYAGKADVILRPHQTMNQSITSVTVSSSGNRFATRSSTGYVILWNTERPKDPLKVLNDLSNDYPTANVEFSPDGSLLCCGVLLKTVSSGKEADSVNMDNASSNDVNNNKVGAMKDSNKSKSNEDSTENWKAKLFLFEVENESTIPRAQITIAQGKVHVIYIKWQPVTNQIFCSLSTGVTRIFYDPLLSKKGALLAAQRAPRREKDPTDFAIVGEIVNPLALPMYRNDPVAEQRKRRMDLKDPTFAKIPKKPTSQGPGMKENTSFFFTQFVMKDRVVDKSRIEDPRDALLKYDAKAKADPIFLGKAYERNQPDIQLHNETEEQEQIEFKSKQKKLLEK